MRIFKLTTAYPFYHKRLYAQNPGLEREAYAEQKRLFDFDAFGMADFWSHALRPHGYDVWEVTANVEPIQRAWAAENGVPFGSDWRHSIPRSQAIAFKPDILYMVDYSTFSYEWIQELKEACPSIRFVVCWCGAPYSDARLFRAHDLVLSCIPELVERFRQMGHASRHLHHGFEPRVLERIDRQEAPDIDFSFVGQIARGNHMHGEREQILKRLARTDKIRIFSPAGDVTLKDVVEGELKRALYMGMQGLERLGLPPEALAKLPVVGGAARWPSLPPKVGIPELKGVLRPSVFGLEMFRTLQRSKLSFNSHIDLSPRSASNMRMFEATGVGSCLVTDWKENIQDLFEPDREVVTYRSADECIEKVQWLLEHPADRQAIAKAGQARTLREHTIPHRAKIFDEILKPLL